MSRCRPPGRYRAIAIGAVLALTSCSASSGAPDAQDAAPGEPASSVASAPRTTGFDVAVHGFRFENFGDDVDAVGMTTAEVVRLFGDDACTRGSGATCTLTPPARAWMREMNESMGGGRCEGMAVLSLLMYEGRVDPKAFGGATAAQLRLEGNDKLQRELAYWFATQALSPTTEAVIAERPSVIVERLRQWFDTPGTSGGYTLGIYQPDGSDGHAVTPIGLTERGPGRTDILVYDNNYPGQTRAIAVDTRAETWSYSGASNPADAEGRYEGDATTKTLDLTPTEARLEPQDCPFCDQQQTRSPGGRRPRRSAASPTQVFLDPSAFRSGVTVRVRAVGGGELPGVVPLRPRGANLWAKDTPPILQVPAGTPFEIELDATAARREVETDVAIVAPGLNGAVDGITMTPGQRDTLLVDPNRRVLRYTTTADETPTLVLGIDDEPDSYEFSLGGVELGPRGGTLEARLDPTARTLTARTTGSADAILLFLLERFGATVDETIENDGLELAPNETMVVAYGTWTGDGRPLSAGVDVDGDGTIDEQFEIVDET
jgi:hypothetical protein